MQKVGEKTTLWNLLDTLTCPSTVSGGLFCFVRFLKSFSSL